MGGHFPIIGKQENDVVDICCLFVQQKGLNRIRSEKMINGGCGECRIRDRAPATFIETLRERMFKPALSSIITENTKVATVSPSDPVYVAAKKMRGFHISSVIITSGIKVLGILTSRDILMRVVAQNLSPELTLVEKVMTPNPECVNSESTILEALHIMHDGKFLHLPVVERDGSIVACVDVLMLTHAAISMLENSSGTMNDMANSMMQKFWDSALALEPPEDSDSHSEMSTTLMNFEPTELGKYPSLNLGIGSSISYKFENPKGHYEDDEGDKILLTCDSDLIGAAVHARSVGQKVLRLYLEFPEAIKETNSEVSDAVAEKNSGWTTLHSGVLAGAVLVMTVGVVVYLKRVKQ
ncbi:CBS domain-containing protein CBSCBSPB3 [Bienertia sinuspersici]